MFDGVYRGRRVLVTGHSGFKGSWLSHWLLELGAEVAGFSLYVPSQPANCELLRLDARMRSVVGDVRDREALGALAAEFRPEIVFHLAAQALVRRSYEDPKTTFDTNLGGTVNMLDAIRATPSIVAAVFITSDKCYENVNWEFGYRETDRLGGKDPYSASKACAEAAISAYARSFFSTPASARIASTRAGNVIGGGDWAQDRILPDCVRAWGSGGVPAVRNPAATRPWQHVLEPLSGYLWLGARLFGGQADLRGEPFNFGPAAEVNQSVRELIEAMAKTWGGQWRVDPDGAAGKPEATLLKLNCDKALHRLGWRATLTFEETVRFTAEWYGRYYARRESDMTVFTSAQIASYVGLATERGRRWVLS